MSSLPESRGRREGKGSVAEAVFSARDRRMQLGHCRICNVLSLMWSAIGNL